MLILYLAAAAFVLFFLPQAVYARNWKKGLSARVYFGGEEIFEGEKEILYEEVENAKRLFLPMVKVKFSADRHLKFADTDNSRVTDHYYRNDIFTLKGNQRIRRQLVFTGARRGFYEIGDISLVCSDLFLTGQDVLELSNVSCLYVYPRRIRSEEFLSLLHQLNGEALTKSHSIPDPFEQQGIREYEPYDAMKDINWKATARTGEYKVNVKGHTALKEVRIFLDMYNLAGYHKDEMRELTIRAAAGIAENFLRQGVRVSLCSNGRDMETGRTLSSGPGTGQSFLNSIYRGLARMDLQMETCGFAQTMEKALMEGTDSAYTVILSSDAGKSLQDILSAFLCRTEDFLWIYATDEKEEPALRTALRKHIRYIGKEE